MDGRDDSACIRLEAGCQGCRRAEVSVTQVVGTEFEQVVPKIAAALDVTG